MSKKKKLSYEEKMLEALKSLPNPIEDKRHNIDIYFNDDRARSNESRFEHVIEKRHELLPSDIKRIPNNIKKAIFKIDKERKDSYNYYIRRNRNSDAFIKISVRINPETPKTAIVKTIFVTKNLK